MYKTRMRGVFLEKAGSRRAISAPLMRLARLITGLGVCMSGAV